MISWDVVETPEVLGQFNLWDYASLEETTGQDCALHLHSNGKVRERRENGKGNYKGMTYRTGENPRKCVVQKVKVCLQQVQGKELKR